jgi:hypothetical protein
MGPSASTTRHFLASYGLISVKRHPQVPSNICGAVCAGQELVARAGVEPATFRFSGGRSYQLSYLAGNAGQQPNVKRP